MARTNLGREKRVVIAGHLDTVPVHDNLPVRDIVDAEPFIWGRGTVDMKAGVAVQLSLAAQLIEPAVDITWVWYDHEEVSSELNGLGRTMRQQPQLFEADLAILGEPTSGLVEGGCNGTLRAQVTFRGRRAHSARSWMGVNAIHAAADALRRLADYEPATVRVDGLDYREGLNAVRASGGVAGNVIPDHFELDVNYRFAPNRSVEAAEAIVRDFFYDADQVNIVDVAPGARPGLNDHFAQSFVRAAAVDVRAKVGWTDVSRFSALGIPALNFGPGDPLLAHADDERVSIAQIVQVAHALHSWLQSDDSLGELSR